MNRGLTILVGGFLAVGTLSAQEFVVPGAQRREIAPAQPVQPRPTIEGIVKEIFTKKPWQLVNPVAPPSYGSGARMVSKDFGGGTPYHSSGWIVAGVEW
jgi:hypothetical protein